MDAKKGQALTEFITIYSIMIALIIGVFAVVSVYLPGIYRPTTLLSAYGFSGVKILGETYANHTLTFSFQNLLSENIQINDLYLLYNGASFALYSCSQSYVPALGNTTCSIKTTLSNPFTVQIDIQYLIKNTTITKPLNITGWISS